MLLKPSLIAAAIAKPMPADLPRPLPAVNETVVLADLSLRTSNKVMMTLAWSKVLAFANNCPTISLAASDFLSPYSSSATFLPITLVTSTGSILLICSEMGSIFNSSSMTIQ